MKVLIVDDHPIVHAGLRRLIAVEPDTEIRELASFTEDRPDLVIMDLNLPGSGGLEMIRRLMIEDDSACILVFSVHDDSIHVARASRQGRSAM
jgi:two-component system invasion response regulator UvrY